MSDPALNHTARHKEKQRQTGRKNAHRLGALLASPRDEKVKEEERSAE